MTGTRDMDDNPSISSPVKTITVADKTKGKTPEEIDGDLLRVWVRQQLGRNRGEDRGYHGTTASYDALLDQRLTVASPAPLDKEY